MPALWSKNLKLGDYILEDNIKMGLKRYDWIVWTGFESRQGPLSDCFNTVTDLVSIKIANI